MKKYYFLSLLLVCTVLTAMSQTTWTGPADGGDWSLGKNWSTGSVPGINDDVVLDGGISGTIHNIKDGDIRTLTVKGNSSVTLDYSGPGVARALRINDADHQRDLDFYIEAGSNLTLSGTQFKGISLANASQGDAIIDGVLTIDDGVYYIGDNTGVNGTVDNKGVLAGFIQFHAGGTYIHAQNAGEIPYPVSWNVQSNCIVTGIIDKMPDLHNLNKQVFGNFIWDCANQLVFNASFAGLLTDFAGDFVIKNTGSGSLYMSPAIQAGGKAEVGGDFIMEGGDAGRRSAVFPGFPDHSR
jgi:hypothetical protein